MRSGSLRWVPTMHDNNNNNNNAQQQLKLRNLKQREKKKTPIIKRPPSSPISHQPKQFLKRKKEKKVSPVDCLVSIRVDIYVELISSFPFWCREACR
jgi:hypothetical protein